MIFYHLITYYRSEMAIKERSMHSDLKRHWFRRLINELEHVNSQLLFLVEQYTLGFSFRVYISQPLSFQNV